MPFCSYLSLCKLIKDLDIPITCANFVQFLQYVTWLWAASSKLDTPQLRLVSEISAHDSNDSFVVLYVYFLNVFDVRQNVS